MIKLRKITGMLQDVPTCFFSWAYAFQTLHICMYIHTYIKDKETEKKILIKKKD